MDSKLILFRPQNCEDYLIGKIYAAFFLALALFLSSPAHANNSCQFKGTAEIIAKNPHEVQELWTMEDEPFLWDTVVPESSAFKSYINWVWGMTDPVQDNLIRIQREYFHSYPKMVKRFNLFLEGQVGTLFDARCFEMYLLARHTASFPLEQRPSEFMAFILRNKEQVNQLRVYFSSGDANPDFSPPTSELVLERIQNDLSQGWIFESHLHSHPFLKQVYPDFLGGTVVPSDGDISSFNFWAENTGLKEAWLTNGITTVKIPKTQFRTLLETVQK